MKLSRRAGLLARNAALWVAVAVGALCIALAGVGFLIGGFYVWVAQHTTAAPAAAITGGVLLVLALLTALIGGAILRQRRRRVPSLMSELGGTVGLSMRLLGMVVRRDPRKAIILSVIAGALAEYLTSEKRQG